MKTLSKNPQIEVLRSLAWACSCLSILLIAAFLLKGTIGYFIFLFAYGWLLWTFVEYSIHRFLMHELIVPGKKDELFNHHNHHANPHSLKVKMWHRILVFSLGISIFFLAVTLNNLFTAFAGFFIGFLFYNFLHYILHKPIGKILLPKIQRAHILHHTRYPNCGYSFSTILWDWLFDTLPPKEAEISPKMEENYFGFFRKTTH
ncbi:fatty acid hydroxylase family protein [Algoriphagus boseongensis]|uniref:Fatty acid hydroxylase family protein n=1 Tax=Algoriphagus boseongensis TaxID=1442587 RepID=A0A4R6T2S8_9BACT|nr:sterol desaturase family protein [Algoriphagus boseongensis]TDQ16454.1 fatty acid hydroxylase family protein [Algoriphagus boseongensis]